MRQSVQEEGVCGERGRAGRGGVRSGCGAENQRVALLLYAFCVSAHAHCVTNENANENAAIKT